MITKNILMRTMIKVKALLLIVASVFLITGFVPGTAHALTLTIDPVEGPMGTEVTIQGLNLYGSGDYSLYWGDSKQPFKQGSDDGSNVVIFSVPQAARGEHTVTLKIEGKTYEAEFTILPSLDADIDEGKVGTEIVLNGYGFNAQETDINVEYDDMELATGIKSDKTGHWTSTCIIPASHSGQHTIIAYGTTPAEELDPLVFTVEPMIRITPNSGGVGTMVNINGTGFDSSETGIVVIYDGVQVKTAISADSKGSWQSSFYAPSSAKGIHSVDAYGSSTNPEEVGNVTYTISPAMRLEMSSGYLGDTIHVGDNIWVSGIGFEENETGVKVTFDGTIVASGIVADAKGSWAVQINVPLGTGGQHLVDSSGGTTTAGDVPDTVLVLSPLIDIEPGEGAIGDKVVISGTAFGKSQELTISYDGNQVAEGTITDAKGSFTADFIVPKSVAGDHTITVTDALASVASASFSLESTPPPVPDLLSPKAGNRTGFIGKSIIEFDWDDIEDPSGVTYLLQIGENPEFTVASLRKEGLTESHYTLTEEEALDRGEYYWRVKAVDNAGNEGEWTMGQVFYVGVMDWWHLAAIIIGGILLLLIIVRLIVISIRRR
jgi:hypothetical protein